MDRIKQAFLNKFESLPKKKVVDFYDYNQKINKILDKDETILEKLDLIVSNIINNPGEKNYRMIKCRKINQNITNILMDTYFKTIIFNFEEQLAWCHELGDNIESMHLKQLQKLIKTKIASNNRIESEIDKQRRLREEGEIHAKKVKEAVKMEYLARQH